MRDYVKFKPSAKTALAVLLIAALFMAAFSPFFTLQTAAAEAWTANTTYSYTQGFTPSGAFTSVTSNAAVTYDSDIPESLGIIEPKAPGYEFTGFKIGDTTVATYDGNGALTVLDDAKFFADGAVELTPIIEAIEYTITYNVNDPRDAEAEQDPITNTNPTTYTVDDYPNGVGLSNLSVSGFTFAGWYLDRDNDGAYGEGDSLVEELNLDLMTESISNNIVLNAVWATQTYTLTIVIGNSSETISNIPDGSYISAYLGTNSSPTPPAGQEFYGWLMDNQLINVNTTQITGDTIITAQFGEPRLVVSVSSTKPIKDNLSGEWTDVTEQQSVSVAPGTYTPEQLRSQLSVDLTPRGYVLESVTWADGTTEAKSILNQTDANALTVECVFERAKFSITIQYYYDLNKDNVADDFDGDGSPEKAALTHYESKEYLDTFTIKSPVIARLQANRNTVPLTADRNQTITVFYRAAEQTADIAGIGGTVRNDDGGLLETTVSASWNVENVSAHSAKADETNMQPCGVLSIDLAAADGGVIGVRGIYTVTIKLASVLEDFKDDCMVFLINEDGSYSQIDARLVDGTLQLTIDASGEYLLVGTPAQSYFWLWVLIALLALLLILLIVLLIVLLVGNKKKVAFVLNDGTDAVIEPVKAKKGDIIELPVPEEREGFIFAGWYLDEECTQPVPYITDDEDDKDEGAAAAPETPDDDPDGAPDADAKEVPEEEAPADEAAQAPADEESVREDAEDTQEQSPAEEAPSERFEEAIETPSEDVTEEVPAEDAPVEETPSEDVTAEEIPAEDAPVEETPSEDVTAEAPAEDAPVDETPSEEVTAEETPAEEATTEEEKKDEQPEDPFGNDIRIFDEPGGSDVTDKQQGGGKTDAMSSKRAKKARAKKTAQETIQIKEMTAEYKGEEYDAPSVDEAITEGVSDEAEVRETADAEAPAAEFDGEYIAVETTADAVEVEAESEEVIAETEEAAAETEEVAAETEEVAAEEAEAVEEISAAIEQAEAAAEEAEEVATEAQEAEIKEEENAESEAAAQEEAPSTVTEGEEFAAEEKPAEEQTPVEEEKKEEPLPVLPEVLRYKVVGNVKLYARWVEKPPEEHIIGFLAGGYVAGVLHTMGKEELALPQAHELDGYEFAGWFMTEEGREQPFTAQAYANKYLYKDLIIYGQYDKMPEPEPIPEPEPEPVAEPEPEPAVPHIITFMADGEVVATVETAGRDALELPAAPVKEGYIFRGWFTDEETHDTIVEESSLVDKDLEEDVTYYAFYEEEKEPQEEEEFVAAAVLPEEDEEEQEEEQEEEDETPEVEEAEEDEEEPEEVDPDAPKVITAADTIKRRTSTMRGRLRYGSDVNKTIYEELVNHLLLYKGVNRSFTNRADNYKSKGKMLAKITLTGKTIKLYLPLDAELYDYDKYHQLITEKNGYEEVPFTLKVKSNRGLKYAKELIDESMQLAGIEKKKKPGEHKSFKELILLQKGSLLIKAKKTDKLRSRVDSQDANAQLSDTEAQELVKIKYVPCSEEVKKTAFVGLDKIEELYNDCDMVNIKTLRKRGLVKDFHNRVKIIGGGTLTKSLKVYADEYSLTAIKMITLLGGKVTKLVEETVEPVRAEE